MSSEDCKDGLVCPVYTNAAFGPFTRRCFDPKKLLGLGVKCTGAARKKDPLCQRFNKNGKTDAPLFCLPKKNGLACQKGAPLFAPCSEKKNIGCRDEGVVCGKNGFCVPSS